MEKEINLYAKLNGHENISLYMPMYGDVILKDARTEGGLQFLQIDIGEEELFLVGADGKYCSKGEICIFPSKEQRDWSLFEPPYMPNKLDKVWVRWEDSMWLGMYFCDYHLGKYRCFSDQKDSGELEAFDECKPINQIPW